MRFIEITPDGLPLLLLRLLQEKGPLLIETASREEASSLFGALSSFTVSTVLFSPLFLLLERGETDIETDRALAVLINTVPDIVITSPGGSHLRLPGAIAGGGLRLTTGESVSLHFVARELSRMGYQRVPLVRGTGEFSVKGDILDISSDKGGFGWRIELFDDEIEKISLFSLLSQRNKKEIESVAVAPLLLAEGKDSHWKEKLETLLPSYPVRELLRLEELIEEGALSPWDVYPLYAGTKRVADLHPRTVIRWNGANERIGFEATVERIKKEREARVQEGALSPFAAESLFIDESLTPDIEIYSLFSSADTIEKVQVVHHKLSLPEFRSPFLLLERLFREKNTLFFPGTSRQIAAITEVADKHSLPLVSLDQFPAEWQTGEGYAVETNLWLNSDSIIELREFSAVIVPLSVLFPAKTSSRRAPLSAPEKESEDILSLEELQPGDLVVHYLFGIAVFEETRMINGTDCAVLRFAHDDKMYVPVYNMHLLYKYRFDHSYLPSLSSLRTKTWVKTREKVKRDIEQVAEHILELYAQREVKTGEPFTVDGEMMRLFVSSFPYRETPDQKEAIKELLADMASGSIVDRLLIGDVGFGKTEVAMRGCVAAAMSGMQSAILVPTTVLSAQHLRTFRERFAELPIQIRMLSRFNSDAENRKVLRGVADGSVDIVIGTHRLLSKDVVFHNLGFLVIDEEHRFGVAQKERIKELKEGVATLSMTATPIPRSLQMALLGVREISFIKTPPGERQPVTTYLVEYSDEIVKEAIVRELRRGGQIYVVHNRISSLGEIRRRLHALLPDLSIAVAHGRMEEDELERTMIDFSAGRYQLLLATSLIESGIDIPLVNTIIIDRADMFGMAQLYQLRGRVGRGDREAFAYLMIPSLSSITRESYARLRVIKQFDGLGRGYDVAMEDLSIRGGGNILGMVQSGKLKGVGYDVYLEMLRRRIEAIRSGDVAGGSGDVELTLSVTATFPDTYIPDARLRVAFYRTLSRIERKPELDGFKRTLTDMFGDPPPEAETLFAATALRIDARNAGFSRVEFSGKTLRLETRPGTVPINMEELFSFFKEHNGSFESASALSFPAQNMDDAANLAQQVFGLFRKETIGR